MSVEPQALDRSALESKARDELVAIASAVGAKPGSRARKGEIVDAILSQAGLSKPAQPRAAQPKAQPAPSREADSDDSRSRPPRPQTSSRSFDPLADAVSEEAAHQSKKSGGNGSASEKTVEASNDASDPTSSTPGESAKKGSADSVEDSTAGDPKSSDSKSGDSQGRNRDGQNRDGQNRDGQNRDGQNRNRNRNRNRDGQNRDGQNRDGQNRDGQNRDRNRNRDNQNRDRNRNREAAGEPGNRKRRRRGREQEVEFDENQSTEPVAVEGLIDLRDDGYGFLRQKGYLPSQNDVYIPARQVRQLGLRKGDYVTGMSRPANRSEKNPALISVATIEGKPTEEAANRPKFEDLTPLFPDEKLSLETKTDPLNMTARIIDLIAPVGKGQRGLIVSPPKAGKTTIMKQIAQSIEANNPEVKLMVLLVDERPEEVTDMRRSVKGEVIASTFDRPSDEHTQISELCIERAKRLVEMGQDVVIILDGITRLARAYNLSAPSTGRIMSGGVDSGALYPPKRFFGAARNIEEGGSLTILATALVETGSKMDEVIFEEFKGTGNMELRLDRKLGERRIYPAIDVDASSTRHEELLFDRKQLAQVWKLRRVLQGLNGDGDSRPGAGLELLIDRMKTFSSNDEFLAEIAAASNF